jgi:hypothetical protein
MDTLYYPILFLAVVAFLLSVATPIAVLVIGRGMRHRELGEMHRRVDEQLAAVVTEQRNLMQTESELLQHVHMLELAIEQIPHVALICLDTTLHVIAIGGAESLAFSLSARQVGMSIKQTTTVLAQPEVVAAYEAALAGEHTDMVVPTPHGPWRLDIAALRNGQVFGVRVLASRHYPT